MRYSFHSEAEVEFGKAIAYYEEQRSGLGRDFAVEVHAALGGVAEHPEAWPEALPGVRRCLMHRFPYVLVYEVHEETVIVYAVMHTRRRPGYWLGRLANPPPP